MSSSTKIQTHEAQQGEDRVNARRKRLSPNSENICKRLKVEDKNMNDTATNNQKRANFSAITNPNGVNKNSTIVTTKPGAAKKLVIKNFKGTVMFVGYVYLQLVPVPPDT